MKRIAPNATRKNRIIYAVSLLLFLNVAMIQAQSGTYEKKNKNGSYCYISLLKNGTQVNAEIFAWWNTASAQTGSYYGKATVSGNIFDLTSEENEPECKVTLSLQQNKIIANYDNCETDHLTEDFNDEYIKITDAVAGDYTVKVEKSYFYKKPDPTAKLKSYLVNGDKVTLNLDRLTSGKWVYVYYSSPLGKETEGYVLLDSLKKADN